MAAHNKGDKELEAVGMLFINCFKGVYQFFKAVFYGIKKVAEKKNKQYLFLIYTAAGIGLFLLRQKIWLALPSHHEKLALLQYAFYGALGLPVLFLYWQGEEHAKFIASFDDKFEAIGFYGRGKKKKRNRNGELVEVKDYPRFLGEEKVGKKVIYSFYSNIPLKEWKDRYLELETVLDCNIVRIENAKSTKQVVKLHTVPADQGLTEYLPWSDEYIREKDFELVVGSAMLEDVTFDLNKVPHALIAGVTGSGKSVLLRCMLWQAIKKGAKIYMIDFKGGVEFGIDYEYFGEVVTDRSRAVEILKELVAENAARLKKFREMGVKNLAEYNEIAQEPLCRIILVCDEVGEMLDKTGLSKEEKQVYMEIEKEMATLARLSRAPGINMILATQRPDAKVIPGQIKNNLPIRISGRMVDQQASEMVLGNTKATEISDIRGRFMYTVGADTVEFQAYIFDDNYLKKGHYQIGKMLTQDTEGWETEKTVSTAEKITEVAEIKGLFSTVEGDQEYEGFEIDEDSKNEKKIKETVTAQEDDDWGEFLEDADIRDTVEIDIKIEKAGEENYEEKEEKYEGF